MFGRLRRRELTHEHRNSQRVHLLQLITFSFFRVRRAKRENTQMATRVTDGARREGHENRETLFFLLGLPPSFRASRGFAASARVHCSHKIWRKRETTRSLSFLGKELYSSFKFFLYYQTWVLWVRQVIPQNIPPTQMISGTHWRYFVK